MSAVCTVEARELPRDAVHITGLKCRPAAGQVGLPNPAVGCVPFETPDVTLTGPFLVVNIRRHSYPEDEPIVKPQLLCFLGVQALAVCCAPVVAEAADPLAFYIGAGVGQAQDTYTTLGSDDRRDTGWKVVGGLRPLPFLGAEAEYLDFGHQKFLGPGQAGVARARADGLFAVGYLPLLPRTLDLFAKVGGERVHTAADGVFGCVGPTGFARCNAIGILHVSETESDFAYGGGIQARLRPLGLRVEYERTDTRFGHPGLLSFGVTFTF